MIHGRSFSLGILTALAVVLPLQCSRDRSRNAEIRRLQASTDAAKSVRHVVIESVTVHAPATAAAVTESHRLAQLLQLVGPTSVAIRETPEAEPVVFTVPPAVIAKMRADSAAIAELVAQNRRQAAVIAADSAVIALQDSTITELEKGRRCGAKCGAVLTLGAAAAVKLLQLALGTLF